MSVVKSKRGQSGMKFIDNARELEVYTIQRVAHFPKRYTFLISEKIAEMAVEIYENVVKANSFSNVLDDHQYLSRLHHFRDALSTCNALVAQLQLADSVFGMRTLLAWQSTKDCFMPIGSIRGARYKSKWKYKPMTSEERREARYWRRRAKRKTKREQYARYDDFDWVFSYAHLYKCFKKCCRNVGWKSSTQRYKSLAPLYVYRAYKKLHKGAYRSKGFFEFNIIERGKKRHIRSVIIDERVVQRCLCDYCLIPLLSRSFIYDNGASLKGKGYHFARKRVTGFLQRHSRKHGREGYALLFDFSKYFDNISHELCKRILRKHVTDPRIVRLTEHFIDMFGDKGLGLGSQVSQIFALASADELDHLIKDTLGIKLYERYMDDGCLIHERKENLQACLKRIRQKCKELGIVLNEKKTVIVKISRGFTWLKTKFYILGSGRILRKIVRESVAKMRRKLLAFRKMVNEGRMSIADVYMSFQSWRAYARCFNAHRSIRLTTDCLLYLYPEFKGDSKWQQLKTKPCSRSSSQTVAAL